MIRTILFIVLMYLIIKIISRLFLSSGTQKSQGRKGGASFFYEAFRQFQQQQQQQNQQRRQPNQQQGDKRFEEIEEAEFEDITEEENSSSKSSD